MTNDEKINLIDSIEDIKDLGDKQFEILRNLSSDEDDFVRSRCAAQLVNFKTEESLNILLKLIGDKDSFVRTEAYDSITIFEAEVVEKALKKAIVDEQDNLARRYAILSWVDVFLSLNDATENDISFLKSQLNNEKSADCRLSYYYSLYLFGEETAINGILSFLEHQDYYIRCTVLSLLSDIANENNKELIKNAVTKLLITEDTIAVQERARRFLSEF